MICPSCFSAGFTWRHAPITDASAGGRALAVGAAATDRGPCHESHDAGSGSARSQERVESNGAKTPGGETSLEFLFVFVCGRSNLGMVSIQVTMQKVIWDRVIFACPEEIYPQVMMSQFRKCEAYIDWTRVV